jgi:hypothetical protein
MKLTTAAKAGLVLSVLGLGTFLAVAVWLKTIRANLVDIPMPMRVGVVGKNFAVDYDGPISWMAVRFDPSVSETSARCLLGATKSELDCVGIAPLLKFSWELRRDGQFAGEGSSADMGSISKAGGAPRATIVGFKAQKKHRYEVTLRFEKDAGSLTIPPPRVQIELDSFVREDIIFVSAGLQFIGFVLCLIGLPMVLIPFLRIKFRRSKNLPEPR